jgi:hypothetical protein
VLGALRNFCVSATVRHELLGSCEKRLVSIAARYVHHANMEVKAKALSILRLIVRSCSDKSGALDVVYDAAFLAYVEQTLNAKTCMEHPSVAGELTRFVCYLPVAAKNEQRMRAFCSHARLTQAVCAQLACEHWVMVNEAVLALNVLTTIDYASCAACLRASRDLDTNMQALFGEQRQATMPLEITLNLIRLFKFLYDRSGLLAHEINRQCR